MDVYAPSNAADALTARPVVIYLHTGNALPPPVNGSPNGLRTDSTAVEVCKRMARRGYVAVSATWRGGWNPLAATEEERRGQLLNAIYRGLHDTRQCTRFLKADAAGANTYRIDPTKVIVYGEGTGGYIALANATLDKPEELFIEKFRPDPFNASVSYVDTTQAGNLNGFNGSLTLYRPNGQNADADFCVNMGGALADTSWLEQGDVPMVSFHAVFDPFAPFTEGIVIVPTTGGPVVPVQGPNLFMELVNEYGNNSSFANLTGDVWSNRARSLYGTTQSTVTIRTDVEGLFPFIRPRPTGAPFSDEASPWQFWDPNSPLATAVVSAGPPPVTAHQASSLSNPDMSPTKARTYLDSVMGYLNPRIVCALELGPCSLVSIDENSPIAAGVEVFPNPANDQFTVVSTAAAIRSYEMFDINGRLVRTATVNTDRAIVERQSLESGVYFIHLQYEEGTVTRRVVLD
jgi:dienelactone hydrolase